MNVVYAYPSNLDRTFVRSLQIAQTANALAKAGINVYFMTGRSYNNAGDDEIFKHLNIARHADLHVIPIQMLRPSRSSAIRFSWNFISHYSILFQVVRLQTHSHIDVIYTRDLKLARTLIRYRGLLRNAKLVFECHDLRSLSSYNPSACKATCLNKDEELVINHVDAIVSISPGLTDVLQQTGKCDQILTAPSGVDLQIFRPRENRSKEKTVAYIGSLHAWKGVDIAIAAMKHLEKDIKLKIIGAEKNDSNLKRLRALIEDLGLDGQVEISEFLSQHRLNQVLSSIGVLVLPLPSTSYISSHFTSPLKLFEYMSMAIPIIASDVPALNWILSHRQNAVLFHPDDPEQLGAAIAEVLYDPALAEHIAHEALLGAQEYTWEKRGQRIAAFFAKLMDVPSR